MTCGVCSRPSSGGARFCGSCGAPLRLDPRFELRRLIGRGAQKRVYQARDSRLARDVAVSVIATEGLDGDGRARVEREARAMGRLGQHPNLVTIYDVLSDDGTLFVISQYIAGGSLAELLVRQGSRPLSLRQALEVARDVSLGLEHAHARGIVHRDVKPANVYLDERGAILGDFGIAFTADESRLTQTGMLVGTPTYMAPEQLRGEQPDPRWDLYSLGATLYELLSGRPPFSASALGALLAQHMFGEPDPIERHRPELPPAAVELVHALLKKRCAERPDSAARVTAQLDDVLRALSTAPPPRPPAAHSEVSARTWSGGFRSERRQLTMLVMELVQASSGPGDVDAEHVGERMRAFRHIAERVLARYEGRVASFMGQKLVGYFGYPLAHEDDACRAVHAALELIRDGAKLAPAAAGAPAVRIGMHSGLAVVDAETVGEPILEPSLRTAERLQEVADPGTLLISSSTMRLVDGRFLLLELSRRQRAALPEAASYRVDRPSALGTRLAAQDAAGFTRLIGRTRELEVLKDCFDDARRGRGQVVLISSEAGLGKSRLVHALRRELASSRKIWLQCGGSPYHQDSALHPVIDLLELGLFFERDDAPEQKLAKLKYALDEGGLTLPRALPLLAPLLSLPVESALPLSAEQQRKQTLETLCSWVMRWTERQTVVLVVEDLHWIDPSTHELLELFLSQAPTASLLVVLSTRPSFVPAWIGRAGVLHLTLRPLSTTQVEEMVTEVAGPTALPESVRAQIVARSDGVPLYVEELTRMVLESARGASAQMPDELRVPATLHDSLMARLDRLGSARAVAQLAATIGREFSYELLRDVAGLDEATLREALRRLVEGDHLYRRGEPPDAQYVFRHALIQEAAYDSLAKSARAEAHARVLAALKTGDTRPELLAKHSEEAGLAAEAAQHWRAAGEKAAASAAYVEATRQLKRALALLESLPPSAQRDRAEFALQSTLGTTLMATTGYAAPETERTLRRAYELGRELGSTHRQFVALRGFALFELTRAQLAEARRVSEELMAGALASGDRVQILESCVPLGITKFFQGELGTALEVLERATSLYDVAAHQRLAFVYGEDPSVVCGSWAAVCAQYLGDSAAARKKSDETLKLAEQLGHAPTLVVALDCAAWLHDLLGDFESGRAHARRAQEIALEHGADYWGAFAGMLHGRLCLRAGAADHGLADLTRGFRTWTALGSRIGNSAFLGWTAEARFIAGDLDAALALLASSAAHASESGEAQWSVDCLRLEGQIRARQGGRHALRAEACFRDGLELARRLGARALELSVLLCLCDFLEASGRASDVPALLDAAPQLCGESRDAARLRARMARPPA